MPLRLRQLLGFFLYYLSFSYYLLLLPLFDPWETDERFRKRLRKATRLAIRMFGVTIDVRGADQLDSQPNTIIVANHSSWFDQLALIASLDLPVAFVTNEKYFKYAGLSKVLRKLGSVPVIGRDINASLKACRETINSGKCLVIYPEGTRSKSLLPFRRGAALLAQQTGAPIQPVVIHGAEEILPRKHSLLKVRPGVIRLEFLPCLHMDESITTKQCMEQIHHCFAGSAVMMGNTSNEQATTDGNATTGNAATGNEAKDTELDSTPPTVTTDIQVDPGVQVDAGVQQGFSVDLESLQPSNAMGGFYFVYALLMTVAAIALSLSSNGWLWLAGQLLLSVTFIQWFAILHEAGHKTMFRTRWLNRWTSYVAGFFALIPGDCWRLVHAKHHYWTGWQDLDVTTETLVPRPLRGFERVAINTCWRLWIPLFASLYRWNNYWNLPRLRGMFHRPRQKRLITANVLGYLLIYLAVTITVGAQTMLTTIGLGLIISMSLQDLLILSQHTHIPMKISNGESVRPFPPTQQEGFTRSLQFPTWFARLVLLNVDAHGLHHMLPRIPGYHLHRLQDRETLNCIRWWKWIAKAKSVPGEVLLFQNRDETGFHF